MRFLKKIKLPILCFIFCFVVPFVVILVLNEFVFSNALFTFNNDFTLCGVDLGGLTKDEAEQKLNKELISTSTPINLELTFGNKNWVFTSSDFMVESNIHTIIDSAYKSNHKGDYFKKIKLLKKIKNMGFNEQVAIKYVLIDIDKKIDEISLEINKEPINSSATFNNETNKFNITKSVNGYIVNKEKLLKDINQTLQKTNNASVEISTIKVAPQLTENHLKLATTLQSTFSTNYEKSNCERKNNINISVKALNGIMINAGEDFSFNKVIGNRTSENGYKEANIIKDGSFVKGMGGGICQVSSTLYNALILANIDVTEAHPHSLPVSYVEPGLDAMVSWGSADLKFKNTTDLPIFIVASANNKTITFKIFGNTKPQNLTIKTTSEINKTLPHKGDKIILDTEGLYSDKIMFKGEYYRVKYPKNGYIATTYKETYINGKLTNKKQLRTATYSPQQGIVYEGTDALPEGMSLPKSSTSY